MNRRREYAGQFQELDRLYADSPGYEASVAVSTARTFVIVAQHLADDFPDAADHLSAEADRLVTPFLTGDPA